MSSNQCFVFLAKILNDKTPLEIKTLINPQNEQTCNYIYKNGIFLEVNCFGDYPSSWFVNDRIIQNGSTMTATPIHPLFLCIPFLLKSDSSKYMQLEDILFSTQYPDVQSLIACSNVKKTMHLVCNVKQSGENSFYQFNKSRCIEWLKSRVERTEKVLQKRWHSEKQGKQQIEQTTYHNEAIRIVGRYINDTLFNDLCSALEIDMKTLAITKEDKVESGLLPPKESVKRESVKAKAKSKSATKKNKLANASKGTKSIMGFFKK